MEKEQIFTMVKNILSEEFEIEETDILPDTHIYNDLDIDSIDVVDLVVRLRAETGLVIEPDSFKQVRTISDLLESLHEKLNN